MDVLNTIELVSFGLFVGTYGTLVGAGGGFLIVPMMLLVYGATPQHAVGTSLTVVFLNALSGSISYAKRKRVDYQTGIVFAIATVPGAVLGAYVTTYLTGRFFHALFGVLLMAIAFLLLARPEAAPQSVASDTEDTRPRRKNGLTRRTIVDAHGEVFVYSFDTRGGILLSFVVGFFSSILGIGGGIIHVPALVYLFSFPAHVATATSHFILAITTGVGVASHVALGHVLYRPALLIGVGVIIGAQIGAALSHRLHGRWLMRLLSLALIFVGVRLELLALGL